MMKMYFKSVLAGLIAISAVFPFMGTEEVSAATKFKDVPGNHWAKDAIYSAVNKGYFKGYLDGTFRPSANITRAEFATLMSRVSNNMVEDGLGSFSDIKGHWAEAGITKAIGMGFISTMDYPNGFKPGTSLTRTEMAKWMASGLAAKNEDFKQALSDTEDTLVPVAEYHKGGLNKSDYPYVSVVLGTGLMAGYPDGTFGPSKTTTRAEVAVILARYETVQDKKASSYQDLNEMREVGLTGTNLLSATPHVYGKIAGTDKITSFDSFANKPYTMMYNRGTMTVHRMIVVDASTPNKPKNLYGKMFLDKDFSWSVRKDLYNVFLEATVVPSDDTSLTNAAFPGATLYNFTSAFGFKSGTLAKYGLTVLPESDNFLKTGFFKKDVPRRFWMHRYLNREWKQYDNGGSMGKYNTLSSFYIPRPE
ncbi:S-layer homology domain-containing protein [Paenibacillus uliginis N3/975]|uniref:S-layer homology domain-containing protein n=1 Tax=Paenibacillus uliginis N3/975 TaxID=1313296 RepID=A0A1X7GPH5_9BACL|nr:S-layer homology domain-containing protein [Paenibacillus uliginis]SMF72287.1 S-layer homology domain-containing protein [Paenibacillus uliginis N3/975]